MTVTVRGPETQVARVTAAKTELFLRNAKSQVERTQAILPQNAQGQTVGQVDLDAGDCTFRRARGSMARAQGSSGARRASIGQPAAGYRLSAVRVDPSTVVLLGDADLLDATPGYIETGPLALNNATSDIQSRLELLVPNGVNVLEGNLVDVDGASIASPLAVRTDDRRAPVYRASGRGLEANVRGYRGRHL